MKKVFYSVLFSSLLFNSFAQIVDFGLPQTVRGKINKTKVFAQMPAVDAVAQITQDEQNRINGIDKIYRFGVEHAVNTNILTEASKQTLPNGDVVYQYGIYCPNAVSINLIFNQFELPTGAKLYLVANDGKSYSGAYTSLNNNVNKIIGTELVYDEKAIIELVEPKSVVGKSILNLGTVVHGYKNLDNFMEKALGTAGDCNIDVNCPLGIGWENQRNAAACVVSGGGICSGSLVNNTSGTIIPYYLTANHCGTTNTAAWVFRFRWERTAANAICAANNQAINNGPTNLTRTGCTLKANNSSSDFILVELNTAPDPAWGIYYNGWDHSDALTVTQATGIHHPDADIKKISRENNAPTQQVTAFNGNPNTNVWYIADWDFGVTEPGSSGSPLFDQNHRTIGVLSGGASACSGTVDNNQYDIYGRFGTGWDLGTTPATRLKDWLDPSSSGAIFIDGVDPSGPGLTIDGGIQNPVGITGTICGGVVTPQISIFNAGSDPLTSATIAYGFDGNTNQTYNWSGNLAQFANAIITLPSQTLSSGNHSFSANITASNGAADIGSSNNTLTSNFITVVNGEMIDLNLILDQYGSETSWEVSDLTNTVLYSGSGYSDGAAGSTTPVNATFCLAAGCYNFKIMDSYGDGMTSTNNPSGSYTITNNSGTILAELTAANANFGTTNTTQFCVTSSAGIEEYLLSQSVSIAPNPAKDILNIQAKNDNQIEAISIYNLTGQLLIEKSVNEKQTQIDIATLSGGMYIVKIQTQFGLIAKEIVVQ